MAFVTGDRVKETTTTTGTGNVTLAGAAAGFRAFSSVAVNGDRLYYAIAQQTPGQWEVGLGTWLTGNVLQRNTVIASSTGAALVNFSAGTKDVFLTAAAPRLAQLDDEQALRLPEATPVVNPPANTVKLFAADRLGRSTLRYLTPAGVDVQLARDNIFAVRNQTGVTIDALKAVYDSGAGASSEPLIALADADVTGAQPAIGVTIESIGNNANGFVMTQGVITNVNTAAWSTGDILYLSTTAGELTNVVPVHPAIRQRIARVLVSNATTGVLQIITRSPRGEADTGVRLTNIAEPAAPPADTLDLYARNRSGRMWLEQIGPSGLATTIQPALFGNNVAMWLPGTAATAAIAFGLSWTVAATQAHPALASTNMLTQMRRATYATSATIGNAAGIRASAAGFWRGNVAGLGGFFFFARFGFQTIEASMQFWCGLSAVSTLLAGDPGVQNNTVCIGKDQADTNLHLMFRSGSAGTKVDLGVPPVVNGVYDVMFFCPPNAAQITARVRRQDNDTVLADNTIHTTNLPQNNVFMLPKAEIRTNAASAVTFALNRIYVENDI